MINPWEKNLLLLPLFFAAAPLSPFLPLSPWGKFLSFLSSLGRFFLLLGEIPSPPLHHLSTPPFHCHRPLPSPVTSASDLSIPCCLGTSARVVTAGDVLIGVWSMIFWSFLLLLLYVFYFPFGCVGSPLVEIYVPCGTFPTHCWYYFLVLWII